MLRLLAPAEAYAKQAQDGYREGGGFGNCYLAKSNIVDADVPQIEGVDCEDKLGCRERSPSKVEERTRCA